jgi:hypothetical protein
MPPGPVKDRRTEKEVFLHTSSPTPDPMTFTTDPNPMAFSTKTIGTAPLPG